MKTTGKPCMGKYDQDGERIPEAEETRLGPVAGAAPWIDTDTRHPTEADAPNRMKHVIWLVCDGFVCEPHKGRWDWGCYPSCTAVAWMQIPVHPKWYPCEPNERTAP